jgi:succinate dehydrogenase / fumarate reductase membrane anchor subunit
MNQKQSFSSAYGWFIQRITGILLAFFLIVHINVLHFGEKFFIDFNMVTQRLGGSFLWAIFYIIFIPVVLFHGLNGIWGLVEDYRPGQGAQKTVKALLWILGIVGTFYGILAITPFL